jgi:tetratricopeptide (TPR) repeat protein
MKRSASLLAPLVVLLSAASICAQETPGGGSTADFKRPANPPVHRQPIPDEAAGGRTTGPAAQKSGGRSAPAVSNAAGVEPGTGRSRQTSGAGSTAGDRPSTSSKPSIGGKLGGLGGIRSGTGGGPPPVPAPSISGIASNTSGTNRIDEIEDVELALEVGNNARDQKPPNYNVAEHAYKQASKLAPNDDRSFIGLGNIYYDQKRNEEAITAYRKAVELKPDNTGAWEALGDIYFRLERYEEAIAATRRSGLNTSRPGPFWTLTWVSLALGKGEDAGFFSNAFVSRWKPYFVGEAPYYVMFAGHLGYREAGRKHEADLALAAPGDSAECPDDKWHCRLFKYLRHEVPEQQLLAEAKTNDKMTEARAYIGIDLALSGRRAEALPHLIWVTQNGNREFVEYHLAMSWVARLEKSN